MNMMHIVLAEADHFTMPEGWYPYNKIIELDSNGCFHLIITDDITYAPSSIQKALQPTIPQSLESSSNPKQFRRRRRPVQ